MLERFTSFFREVDRLRYGITLRYLSLGIKCVLGSAVEGGVYCYYGYPAGVDSEDALLHIETLQFLLVVFQPSFSIPQIVAREQGVSLVLVDVNYLPGNYSPRFQPKIV